MINLDLNARTEEVKTAMSRLLNVHLQLAVAERLGMSATGGLDQIGAAAVRITRELDIDTLRTAANGFAHVVASDYIAAMDDEELRTFVDRMATGGCICGQHHDDEEDRSHD